jgi:very-short-patch-repair endonuclease
MTEQEFLRILGFYLACVEAEDRHSLTKELSALHHSLVSPWGEREAFFFPGSAEVVFEADHTSDRNLLLGGAAQTGGSERFFYGYPVFLDEKGFLSPLFVAEVEVQHCGADSFAMRHAEAGEIHFNCHVLRRQHAQAEEVRATQEELEGEFGSFADRLRAAFEALGLLVPDFPPDRLEPYPDSVSPRNRWFNRPILFKSERSVYTHNLQRELEDLAGDPRLSSALGETAAGVIAGVALPASRRPVRDPPARPALLQVLPLNRGQEDAARAGLESPLTVVTGPPGTGKSQVVVDLLASCALAGRPVLFASKNNKAVDVVRERLREILGEERDWTLRLGNRKIMDEERQEMDNRLGSLRPEAVPPPPSSKLLYELDQQVAAARRRIEELQRTREEYAGLERERRVAEGLVEPSWVDLCAQAFGPLPDLSRVERLGATAEATAGRRPIGFWLRLIRALAPAVLFRRLRAHLAHLAAALPEQVRRDLDAHSDTSGAGRFVRLAENCGRLALIVGWRLAEDRCGRALAAITAEEPADVLAQRLEQLQRRRSELACEQLRTAWTGRIAPRAGAVRHALDLHSDLSSRLRQSRGSAFFSVLEQFKGAVRRLSADLPIWAVANLSVRNALPLEPAIFDLVIIDEASQCDIPSALPLLFRARRALVIGDEKQLRHISTLSQPEEENLASQHGVADLLATWSYNRQSLYALADRAIIGRGGQPLFLAEHYRSHPEIIEFSNQAFYGGQLILRTALGSFHDRLKGEQVGIFWHDVRGAVPRSGRSAINEIEVRAVLDLLDEWARTGFLLRSEVSFGIVTPFKLQAERLIKAVRARPWCEHVWARPEESVGTAHRFQGDERDVMIFSPVVADGMRPRLVRWAADTHQLLNVAITRARGALHVVGDLQACLASGGCLADLAAAARDGHGSLSRTRTFESPAEARTAELLAQAGLWYAPQHDVGRFRLDFLVVTPFGTRYDIEVDGRGHLTDEAIRRDEIRDAAVRAFGLRVLRVDARRIFNQETAVRELLQRLV